MAGNDVEGDTLAPYRVEFDPAAIDDLRGRLEHVRWPESETVEDWSQGAPLDFVQDLVRYWRRDYDFDAAAARMNAWPNFITRVDDVDIHFVHARSPEPDALPLVISHGWPGSFLEYLDVIGPLTDPASHGGDPRDAFHVVCPSLPGYGFSGRPSTRGRGLPWIADAWSTLMARVGYDRYGAQGGDWGSAVTAILGEAHRDRVIGIHINMPTVALPVPDENTTEQERRNYEDFQLHTSWGTGYQHVQSTRPQTLGYGLVDSPVGQLAWIVEKFCAWTDCDGDPYTLFTREQLLDNATLYWFTATAASSARLYWESAGPAAWSDPASAAILRMGQVTVPTGCSVFPRELRRPSRRQAERRFVNLHYWNEPAKGGHFAAFEQPALFVDEVRASFRSLRKWDPRRG
ncbi:epoxide hydrolase family protein [Frankia sp. AgKG'84/4]|uniref:epoxide hydrolase family protein n=1 Tax=Frankia sp. AgKG'84/4 TaxID=573490 RepID=UPI00200CEE9C|nr:epoxide hydrolase family protein [Frankia sp. AgKG'84/4]MCL9793651.1 epoxide hydrolase 1 [Frankia sp. AgKG'84/4]